MAEWPADGNEDWNAKMLAYLAIGHETDGTHGTKSGFQNRGDPASSDFDQSNLTSTSAAELDLSSIAPSNTKCVLLALVGRDATAGNTLHVSKNGNSNLVATGRLEAHGGTQLDTNDVIVPVDTDIKIQYQVDSNWDSLSLTVKGWWI